jgi:hypothetical protein
MSEVSFYFDTPIDLSKIRATFELCFNQKFDEKYWKWRFTKNPFSNKIYISYIMKDETLASYYAVSPCKINFKGETSLMALSNMTMTHPDFRGKGYFTLLANELFRVLKNDNYIGVYGFANNNSHYGFRKNLRWQDLSILNEFSVAEISKRTQRFLSSSDFVCEVVDVDYNLNQKVNQFEYVKEKITVIRSFEYLKWRINDNPSQKYFACVVIKDNNIVGYIPFKKYQQSIDLMDYLYSPELREQKNIILISGINHLLNTYQSKVNIWSNLFSDEHLNLEKFGFTEKKFYTYFGVIPFNQNDDYLLNYKNWHIRFTDSDVF